MKRDLRIEWPTLSLIVMVYLIWGFTTLWISAFALWLAVPLTGIAIALFSSLQHEIIHGHPTSVRWINEALGTPALILAIPFQRFRDTHLAHHLDAVLTDPFDDPESNFLDGGHWEKLPKWAQRVLSLNNTLAGRLLVGPFIAQIVFMRNDWKAIRSGDRAVLRGWLWHIPSVAGVLMWVVLSPMPLWAYLISAYIGISILKIRTFLEHQAHEKARGRTVIIEDNGPLALMFLNNNYHVVHHMHPRLPWYRLPKIYHANKERYLRSNEGYVYSSYSEIFRKYLFKAKDPVPHPLWRRLP